MRIPPLSRHSVSVEIYRRRLPHDDVVGQPVFLTWRLHGSLPPGRHFEISHLANGQAFAVWDRLLDNARIGPLYLRQTSIAAIVEHHILGRMASFYDLHAWVIMPNHIHLLITPHQPLAEILKRLKGATAREINVALGRRGTLWQQETFDRRVRNEAEFHRVTRYIESNPVVAGFAKTPADFRWSSAWEGGRSARGPISIGPIPPIAENDR